jgi:hypothetical protein
VKTQLARAKALARQSTVAVADTWPGATPDLAGICGLSLTLTAAGAGGGTGVGVGVGVAAAIRNVMEDGTSINATGGLVYYPLKSEQNVSGGDTIRYTSLGTQLRR